MKTNWILLSAATILLSSLSACSEEEIGTYEMDESKVYFQVQSFTGSNGAAGYRTDYSFSFVDLNPELWTSVTLKATVQLLGAVKDYDRAVKVVVDTERSTMTEGDGYVIDLDTLKIKAGASKGEIGVRFLRNKSIRERIDTLVLKLLPNENFTVLETYKSSNVWSDTNAADIDGTRYLFAISEIYKQPGRWSIAQSYFGDWNATKYAYINALFGFTTDDWEWETVIVASRMSFYARRLQAELQRRADEGNPVIDEDGSYMQLPDAYRVDYSNVVNP